MSTYMRFVAVILAALVCVLSVQEAYAFNFPSTASGSIELIKVEERYSGELWAVARVESWSKTGNTIWTHCRDVVASYSAPRSDIEICQNEVARVNKKPLRVLQQLDVGKSIILPLTRTQALEISALKKPEPPILAAANPAEESAPSTNDQTLQALRDQIALQGREIADLHAQLVVQDGKHAKQIDAIVAHVDTLTQSVQIMLARTPTATAPVIASNAGISDLLQAWQQIDLWTLLTQTSWGPFLALGLALLVFGLFMWVPFLGIRVRRMRLELNHKNREIYRLRRELGRRNKEVARQQHILEKDDQIIRKLDDDNDNLRNELERAEPNFDSVMYEFDGAHYPIKLFALTEKGKLFTTPFADSVLERNLKSHFAHATKPASKEAAAA